MGNHAILSASSSHRWLHCPLSATIETEIEGISSEAAEEGTAAHALCEHKLRKALKMRSIKPTSRFDCDEMDQFTDVYVQFVLETLEKAKHSCTDPIVLIEQRLDFSRYVPDGFGTGDCVIVSDQTLHIIDFKYGMGVLVDAQENPQMMLYALGALEIFDTLYDITEVSMTIYQPRRENISTWTVPVEELLVWARDILIPRALLAAKGEGEYCPGDWCQFCRVSARCRARAEAKLKLAEFEFALPPLLSDDEIEEILSSIGDLTNWANDIMSYAMDAAINHGKQWHGFKVVEGRSNRKYKDEDAVAVAAKQAGYRDIYKQSLITITEMEKLMGKQEFREVLGDLVIKPLGKPTLVPETDKRPAIDTAKVKNEFMEE